MSKVLSCPMDPDENDAGAPTVGGYLSALLEELWKEGEAFSGKRPFGNSGWEWEVYAALVRQGLVDGVFDSDGYLEDCDVTRATELVIEAIRLLGEPRG